MTRIKEFFALSASKEDLRRSDSGHSLKNSEASNSAEASPAKTASAVVVDEEGFLAIPGTRRQNGPKRPKRLSRARAKAAEREREREGEG